MAINSHLFIFEKSALSKEKALWKFPKRSIFSISKAAEGKGALKGLGGDPLELESRGSFKVCFCLPRIRSTFFQVN